MQSIRPLARPVIKVISSAASKINARLNSPESQDVEIEYILKSFFSVLHSLHFMRTETFGRNFSQTFMYFSLEKTL